MTETYPQKVLFLSDAHIGAKISRTPEYQASLIGLMTQYKHVCMVGDNWELFYIGKHHVKAMSNMLEILTGKSSQDWKKEFHKSKNAKSRVENIINGAQWFTQEFLDKFPNVQLHVIGGNHENVRRFHNEFTKLQAEHANFEWSPQGILLGRSLVTHGHLPMDGTPYTSTGVKRLRDAENSGYFTGLLSAFGSMEQHWQENHNYDEVASEKVISQLKQWDKTDLFQVSHNRIIENLDLDKVDHIVFGHTHVKFANHHHKDTPIIFHNTGAIVKAAIRSKIWPGTVWPGILEASLHADGTLTDFKAVELKKDIKVYPLSESRILSAGR